MDQMNVSITDQLAGYVRKKVKSGRYNNASEVVREALRRMGRTDLIGGGKQQLVPSWQPAHTQGPRHGARSKIQPGVALTQHTGLPPRRSK